MGHSPAHAGSVALVLKPTSGHVSSQFHVFFNDTFSTVPYMREGTIPPHWAELIRNSTELITDESFDIAKTWFEGTSDPTTIPPLDVPLLTQEYDFTPGNEGDNQNNEGDVLASKGVTQPKVTPSTSYHEGDLHTSTSAPNVGPALAPVSTDLNDPFDLSAAPSQADSAPVLPQVSKGDALKMPKRLNLEKYGLIRSVRIASNKSKLTALLTGVAVFLVGAASMAFSTVHWKAVLSVT